MDDVIVSLELSLILEADSQVSLAHKISKWLGTEIKKLGEEVTTPGLLSGLSVIKASKKPACQIFLMYLKQVPESDCLRQTSAKLVRK